ncbi:MAG: winged helix-turn-helix domain-containing protein [Dehalococcoidia bacterium]
MLLEPPRPSMDRSAAAKGGGCEPTLRAIGIDVQAALDRVGRIDQRLAVLHSNLQTLEPSATQGHSVVIGDLVIDADARQVFISDSEIDLTITEFRLLYKLACNVGQTVSYREMRQSMRSMLGPATRYLRGYIKRVSARLDESPSSYGWRIQKVRGIGYRLLSPVGRGAGADGPATRHAAQ